MLTTARLLEIDARLARWMDQLDAEEEAGRIHDPVELERLKKVNQRWRAYERSIEKKYGNWRDHKPNWSPLKPPRFGMFGSRLLSGCFS
jgi:hypothetical protein